MGPIIGILVSACVISVYEIRLIRKEGGKKEVGVFIALVAIVCGLFIAMGLHVPMPNPLAWIERFTKWTLGPLS